MAKRVISGIILTVVSMGSMAIGGNILLVLLFLSSCIGFYELFKTTEKAEFNNKLDVVRVVGVLGIIGYYIMIFLKIDRIYLTIPIIVTLFLILLMYVFTYPKYHINQITMAFFSFFYVTVMLSFVYFIRQLEQGFPIIWLILIVSWWCDTCAFTAGKTMGKHKLVEKLSPKKTIEGFIGGVLGAAFLGGALAYVFLQDTYNVWYIVLISIICAVISQLGDLVASAVKRNYNIKDFGNVIPGHGGIMDRFDSMIFVAPVLYFLLII